MSDFCKNLRKYRLPKHKEGVGCILGPGTLEDHVHCVIRMCSDWSGAEMVDVFIEARDKWPGACRHGVSKYWRRRTGLLKMAGTRTSPYCHEQCYWELGYGCVPYKAAEEMGPEARRWLCEDTVLGGPIGEDAYMDMLYVEVQDFMYTELTMPEEQTTIPEWVATGRRMEGKAGTGGKIGLAIDGKIDGRSHVGRNRWQELVCGTQR